MTPDAWSNATLADVKRGGVLRRTDLQLHLFGNKQVGEMTSTVVGVPGEFDHTLCWS